MAESVDGLCDTECIKRVGPFKTVDELEPATLHWVDRYNTVRLRSAPGSVTAVEHEQAHDRHIDALKQPLAG